MASCFHSLRSTYAYTCVGDALYSSLRVAFTYPATTLLESHNTTYAQVSAVERLCLSESIDVLYLVLYTLFVKKKKSLLSGFVLVISE